MTTEQLAALRITIDYLDSLMDKAPNKQLADVSNYLEDIYQEETN